jgi:hypothetical protein
VPEQVIIPQQADVQPLVPGRTRTISKRARILFILFVAALMAVFVEVTLQLWYRASVGMWLSELWAIPIYEEDPIRVYRVKPNLDHLHKTREFTTRYQTDALGLRTDGRSPLPVIPKPADCFRVLSLGPSFAFGWGVNYEDAYIKRIASGLQVPGKRVELINLGTPSQPISYQLKWLRETGYVYQPDLIVQTVYGDGDDIGWLEVDDRLPEHRPYVRDGYLYHSKDISISGRLRSLRRYSAIIFYGWHAYYRISGAETATGDGREFYTKPPPDSMALADCLKRYQSYIQFVHNAVTNRPHVVFLYIPAAWIVRPADIIRVSHKGRHISPFLARERIALLSGVLNSNQVNLIDTTPALVQHDREGRTYHLYDIHFTALGNKVVADHALPIIQNIGREHRPAAVK